jgi:hypothetical protein
VADELSDRIDAIDPQIRLMKKFEYLSVSSDIPTEWSMWEKIELARRISENPISYFVLIPKGTVVNTESVAGIVNFLYSISDMSANLEIHS